MARLTGATPCSTIWESSSGVARLMSRLNDFCRCRDRVVLFFVRSVAAIWLFAAIAKLFSLGGDPRAMSARDVLFGIRNAYFFVVAAQLETIAACYLFFGSSLRSKLMVCTIGSLLLL